MIPYPWKTSRLDPDIEGGLLDISSILTRLIADEWGRRLLAVEDSSVFECRSAKRNLH